MNGQIVAHRNGTPQTCRPESTNNKCAFPPRGCFFHPPVQQSQNPLIRYRQEWVFLSVYLYPCRRSFSVKVVWVEPALGGARDEDHAEQEEAHQRTNNRLGTSRNHHRHFAAPGKGMPTHATLDRLNYPAQAGHREPRRGTSH